MARSRTGTVLTTLLISGGILWLGWQLFKKITQKIHVVKVNFKIEKVSLTEVRGHLILSIQNNSGATIPIKNVVGGLYWKTYKVMNIDMTEPVTIQPGSTTPIIQQLYINWSDLAGNILDIIKDGGFDLKKIPYDMTIGGTISSPGLNVPFSQPVIALI